MRDVLHHLALKSQTLEQLVESTGHVRSSVKEAVASGLAQGAIVSSGGDEPVYTLAPAK